MGRSGVKGDFGEKGERGPKGPSGPIGVKGEPGKFVTSQGPRRDNQMEYLNRTDWYSWDEGLGRTSRTAGNGRKSRS